MRCHFLVVLLVLSLVGCVQPFALKPGSRYISNAGTWVEVGTDGKAHQVALPLDQAPIAPLPSPLP
jgi:hypothetical protein